MGNYFIVTEDQLITLQQGLDIVSKVSRELLPSSLYLYGVVGQESPLLEYVNSAVWEESYAGEVRSESMDIKTAVVAIRLSEDVLAALLGGGLKCDDEEFAYSLQSEIRISSFTFGVKKPVINVGMLSKVALADDSYWIKDFFQSELPDQASDSRGIIRTEPVTQKGGVVPETLKEKESSLVHLANVLLTRKFGE